MAIERYGTHFGHTVVILEKVPKMTTVSSLKFLKFNRTYIPDNSILQATVFSFKKPLMKKYSAQVTLLETLNLSIKTLS